METSKIAICIPTCKADLDLFYRLSESIDRFNIENIPVVVICPDNILDLLRIEFRHYIIVDERFLLDEIPYSVHGLSSGYITQELIKFNLYKLSEFDNFLIVDSDSKFVRNFSCGDFFSETGELYSILTQDKELQIEPFYRIYSESRDPQIKQIYDFVGVVDKRFMQVQMNPLFSKKVLADLISRGFPSLNLTPMKALEISPFEYSWYNAWLLREKIIPIVQIEPLFKTFHTRGHYLLSLIQGISEEDIARGYIGVVYNSNWYKDYKLESLIQRLIFDIRSDQYFFRFLKNIKRVMFRKGRYPAS